MIPSSAMIRGAGTRWSTDDIRVGGAGRGDDGFIA